MPSWGQCGYIISMFVTVAQLSRCLDEPPDRDSAKANVNADNNNGSYA